MSIKVNALAEYAKACGVGRILQTTPCHLKGVNLAESKLCPLLNDSTSFRRIEDLGREDLTKLLDKAIKSDSDMFGCEAKCFNIERYPNLLLRVTKRLLYFDEFSLSKYTKLVPLDCPSSEIANNPNLGLPLFAIVDGAQKNIPKAIAAKDLVSSDIQMLIVRKVLGDDPGVGYRNELLKLFGFKPKSNVQAINIDQLHHYLDRGLAGKEEARAFLNECRLGICSRKHWDERSVISDTQAFYENYRRFIESYIDKTDKISKLPNCTFEKAVADIKMATNHGLIFDFNNTGNTLIDFKNETINFVDLNLTEFTGRSNMGEDMGVQAYQFPHWGRRPTIDDLKEDFQDVLLGRRCIGGNRPPREYIIFPDDKQKFDAIYQRLATKISQAWM